MNARRFVFGTLLIGLGAIYLSREFGWLDDPDRFIAEWWPAAAVFVAVVVYVANPRRWLTALVIGVAGGLLLLDTTGTFDLDDEIVGPVILIGIGLLVLFGRRGDRRKEPVAPPVAEASPQESVVHNAEDV